MYRTRLAVTFAVLALSGTLMAHHSVPVNFDQSKEVTIKGKITEIRWINPHSRFRIETMDESGAAVEWLVEMGAANTMKRAGFEMERFAEGDVIEVIGAPGRRGRVMLLRTAVLEDGTRLSP